jgi:hypothetical protein
MRPVMFARIAGFVMVIMGVLALIPNLNVIPANGLPALDVNNSYGLFLGYVPMNILNKILMIAMGAVGIAVSYAPATALPGSIRWSRVLMVLSAVLALLGLFDSTNTLFGYMPLYGWNVATSAVFAILGAYYGFALTARVPDQKMAPSHSHVAGVR